ncbi:MAG TPA: hypothetical protein VFZ27_13295 [Terriglobia bacterium]|nr:hypothetical protein [Terriglobia bacterium]
MDWLPPRAKQQVEMLGHQDPSGDLEAQLSPQLAECLHPTLADFF